MPAAAATQMQSQMEGFTKAKSLNAILVQARTLPLGSPSSTSASAPVAIASAAPALDLQALLIGIVAERTGYPHEMLGLEADLEADLGIDSIKRVEIPGAFQKALPAAAGDRKSVGSGKSVSVRVDHGGS